jgi:polar amino acid transport system substrate-binding protein
MFHKNTGRIRPTITLLAALGAGCLVLGACSSGSGSKSSSSSTSAGSATGASTNSVITTTWNLQADPAVAALVPQQFKSAGIQNGIYNDYPPEEFLKDNTLVGIQPDIVLALSEIMGVPIHNLSVGKFDSLIPSLVSGRFTISSSDFGVTAARLKQVDFVTEFGIGTAFGVKTGNSLTINKQTDLCGHSMGVQAGSYFIDQVNTVSQACTAAGLRPLNVLTYPDDGTRTLALTNGRTDVTATGQDAMAYAATSQHVPLVVQSFIYESLPQGIIIAKNSGLGPALEAAMHDIVKNGTYAKILAKWGLTSAAYTSDHIKLLTNPSQAS